MAGGGVILCRCGGCTNGTGCTGATVLETCTGQKVAVNRLVGTLSISGSATIDFTDPTDGDINGKFGPLPGDHGNYPIQDFTASASLSGSLDFDVRKIVATDSPEVGVSDTLFPLELPPGASGSATASITVSWASAPTGWTKVKNLRTVVSGFLAAEDAGSGQARVFGEIQVSIDDLYSWDAGGGLTAYTVVSAGLRCTALEDTRTVNLCDGEGVDFSDSSASVTVGVAPEYGDTVPTTGVETGSGSASLSATLSRETEYPAGGTCDTCARAYDVVYSHRVTNNSTGHWTQYDATARAVQECPTDRCAAGSCRYVSPEITVTRTRDTGSPLTFTPRIMVVEPIADEIRSDGKRAYKAYFIDPGTGEQDGTPEIFFYAGPCPGSAIEIYAFSDSFTFDGEVISDFNRTLTLEASDAIEGDPNCICEPPLVDTNATWKVENANESGVLVPAVESDGSNGFAIYWSTPRPGAHPIGIDAHCTPWDGLRNFQHPPFPFRGSPSDVSGVLSTDDRVVAIIANGTVVATDVTPLDPTAWSNKHSFNIPAAALLGSGALNDIRFQVLDTSAVDSDGAGMLQVEWNR